MHILQNFVQGKAYRVVTWNPDNTSKWLFCHTTAHRKKVVISFWTSFKMLWTYQILRQPFEMNGSCGTTREPLRDWKFAKSSTVLRKRSRDKPNLRGWVLLHMPSLVPNSRKCWFLCWTYRWCTRRSKLKQRTRFTRRDMTRLAISKFGFCQDRCFL